MKPDLSNLFREVEDHGREVSNNWGKKRFFTSGGEQGGRGPVLQQKGYKQDRWFSSQQRI